MSVLALVAPHLFSSEVKKRICSVLKLFMVDKFFFLCSIDRKERFEIPAVPGNH